LKQKGWVDKLSERILLVDDDKSLNELLSQYLTSAGFEVASVTAGEKAISMLQSDSNFDLLVVDVMMPGITGLELLPIVRSRWNIPVIMLTGRGEDIDRILGLEMGADDYLAKPCNPRELLARIKAVLRRSGEVKVEIPTSVELHGICINSGSRRAIIGEDSLTLTTAEFDVLNELMRNAGTVVSREDLTRRVLHRELTPYDRSIDVHVSRVRTALRKNFEGRDLIITVRGVGYQFAK
jgi:DNA-binding response OmpR family regulator